MAIELNRVFRLIAMAGTSLGLGTRRLNWVALAHLTGHVRGLRTSIATG